MGTSKTSNNPRNGITVYAAREAELMTAIYKINVTRLEAPELLGEAIQQALVLCSEKRRMALDRVIEKEVARVKRKVINRAVARVIATLDEAVDKVQYYSDSTKRDLNRITQET